MSTRLTFNCLLRQYTREKPLSSATIKTYKDVVSLFLNDTGYRFLDDPTFDELLEWRLRIIERTSDITWNNYLRHMRALWKFAIQKQYVPEDNPFKRLHWGKYRSNKTKTITSKEFNTILNFLSDEQCMLYPGWFWKTVVQFMYYTGVRRKQLVTLTWQDIDFIDKTVRLSAEGEKTDFERLLPIENTLILELRKYQHNLMLHSPLACKSNAQLFNITTVYSRYSGRQMTEFQLSGFFKRLGKHVGFPISAHRLRHTMATEIAKSGKIKPLQQILGHADIRTTMNFYVHPDMDELRSLIQGLG